MTRISSCLVVIAILLDTVSLSHEVALTLIIDPVTLNCIGGGVGLTNTSVLVEYRIVNTTSSPASVGEWRFLAAEFVTRTINIEKNEAQIHHSAADGFQLRLLQLEHGGRQCNCWRLNSITVDCGGDMTDNSTAMCSQQGNTSSLFCGGYASRARGLITEVYCSVSNNSEPCPGDSSTLLPSGGPALPSHCETSDFRIEVSYQLFLDVNSSTAECGGRLRFDEAIEFAMRTSSSSDAPWIPLLLTYQPFKNGSDGGPNDGIATIRGYNVTAHFADVDDENVIVTESVHICGDMLYDVHEVQFRWMSTSEVVNSNLNVRKRIWALANVTANLINESENTQIFQDTFGSDTLNSSLWMESRRGNVTCAACEDTIPCVNNYLTFGAEYDEIVDTSQTLVTRIALTKIFSIASQSQITQTTFTTTPPSFQRFYMNMIMNNPSLEHISNSEPLEAIDMLQELVTLNEPVEAALVVYLLGDILKDFNSINMADQEQLIEGVLSLANTLIRTTPSVMVDVAVVGSSLLSVLDRLGFEVLPETGTITSGNITVQTKLISPANGDFVTTINSEELFVGKEFPKMSIQVPSELIEMFADSDGNDGVVRAVSYLYYNVEGLFPSGLPGENDTELASGIVSTALQCGTGRCPTDDLELINPVLVSIQHSDVIKTKLTMNNESFVRCVFWEFIIESSILSIGQWSDRGCNRSESLSNTSVTVCECDHLTHFAILLSAAPLNLSQSVTLSLEIISYVGVSISLVAMALTIITFIILKSLHNMRNYIHINLCISLGIAQLIFVAGVDQSASGHVPIHCQVIAVLLHYFFLVSFMWMLMEGVVLYVALVHVFVTNEKLYMLAFTIASYGIPLLYLGLLTLPLGFALPTQPNYGYDNACFLNPKSHFIWAFILPVIVIILINVLLFVIVARVMWKHQKKVLENAKIGNVKKWLRSAIFLVIIMGLTWILGVLIVEVDELVSLAYIYTIMVAFQGLFIFLIFVVFSKQVREAYAKFTRAKVNKSDFLSRYFGFSISFNNPTSLAKNKKQNKKLAPPAIELGKHNVPVDSKGSGGGDSGGATFCPSKDTINQEVDGQCPKAKSSAADNNVNV